MDWGAELGLHVAIYLGLVFLFFGVVPVVCFYVRIENRTLAKICPPRCQRQPRRINRNRSDRQNTVELGRQHSRYGDIFYIEPNSQEAARIQEQLEKDEKDLPSYEEVMRMCNLTTPTAAAAALTQPPMMETSAIGIAALPAPPYSEIDPHRSVAAPPPSIATVTTVNMSEPSPSTSRAAQITT
ncbi:uncharacterized protein LOC6579160 isoform X4 [Drosophila mojavensis]|uniref:Uncharacterized protein, isoform W n=1 Tax=Drosophila mojavensis TaxID=7230 RepID=A0A0Q9XA94_DROMO|nr:uncharacterized protein LOC6579160 isoform X4 [Drosophila mojavensis]KRG04409.1 uncharacterized protein Dmoj_GI20257, isoform W [Drosophila mojavensis]